MAVDGSVALSDKSILVTGGTGSFGQAFVASALAQTSVRRIVVYSRDELKQHEMRQRFGGERRLHFVIGDVRDRDSLCRAMANIDTVVHAGALKQITTAEYNPFEAVRTNVTGAENVVLGAIDAGVRQVIALSTDKASSPANLYGATKLVSDKFFVAGNALGDRRTRMAVVRYGNVAGSRGSVIPFFRARAASGRLPITDERMTRFHIGLDDAVAFVMSSLGRMRGGEIFVPKLPSFRIVDLARAVAPDAELDIVGIRPGEKLHEELISDTAARLTLDMGTHYVIQPDMDWWPANELVGETLPDGFRYTSDDNSDWLDVEQLRGLIESC